jgi:hypothetical protein
MSVSEEKMNEISSEEDRKLLVSLLNEYSGKLALICDKIELKNRRNLRIFSLFGFGLLFFGAISLWLYQQGYPVFNLLFGVVFGLFGGSLSLENLRSNHKQKESSVRDARVIAKRLEKVVRLVSQMHEQSASSVSIRLEMDLRLADAEIVLEHYEALTQKSRYLETAAKSIASASIGLR